MLSFQAAASPLLALVQIPLCPRPERDQLSCCYLIFEHALWNIQYGMECSPFSQRRGRPLCYASCSVNQHATYDLTTLYETADLHHLSLRYSQCRCKASYTYRYSVARSLLSRLVNTLRKESSKTTPPREAPSRATNEARQHPPLQGPQTAQTLVSS
jgi:hypothetical protein